MKKHYLKKMKMKNAPLKPAKLNFTNIVNSFALLMQVFIALCTLFYVIIPGQKILDKDAKIKEITNKKSEIETDYKSITDKYNDLVSEYVKLIEKSKSLSNNIDETKLDYELIKKDLFNAEITILINNFQEYIEVYNFKYVSLNDGTVERMNLLFKSYNEEDTDDIKLKVPDLPDLYFTFGEEDFDFAYNYFLTDYEKSNVYIHSIDSYFNLFIDITLAIEGFNNPSNISIESYTLFITYLKNILKNNKLNIDHINDAGIVRLEKDWDNLRNILYEYKDFEFLSYTEYLNMYRDESISATKKYKESEKVINKIRERVKPYDFTHRINSYFISPNNIIDEILLLDINSLYLK